jgi:hypothetical protein
MWGRGLEISRYDGPYCISGDQARQGAGGPPIDVAHSKVGFPTTKSGTAINFKPKPYPYPIRSREELLSPENVS